MGFPCSSTQKESACSAGDLGSIPGLGRSPGAGNCYLPQYSALENSMDSSWGHKELDTTERFAFSHTKMFVIIIFAHYDKMDSKFLYSVPMCHELCTQYPL